MTQRARRFALPLVLLLAGATPLLTAHPARAQDDAAIQMARERFQEGVKYYDQKQYDKARAAFLQAYALKRHPAVLLNLAQSELRSGHEAEAAKHFSQYMREANASPAERQEAEKGLAAAKANVAEFTVTVEESNADVFVDGNLEGRSPLPGPVYLKPGAHTLEARREGKTASATVTASAGQAGTADLSFSGASSAAPIAGAGGAAGAAAGSPGGGPAPGTTPPPGGSPGDGGIQVDTSTPRQGFLSWATENKLAWVGGGLTLVGLAGGIGFALAASSSYDDAEAIRQKILTEANAQGIDGPCRPPVQAYYANACSKYQDRVDTGDGQKTMAVVGFVVAGVAAAGTVVYYFVDTASPSKKAAGQRPKPHGFGASVAPVVAPGHRGLAVVGHF